MKDSSVIKVVLFEYVMACRLLHQQIAAVQFPHFAKKSGQATLATMTATTAKTSALLKFSRFFKKVFRNYFNSLKKSNSSNFSKTLSGVEIFENGGFSFSNTMMSYIKNTSSHDACSIRYAIVFPSF